MIDGFFRLRHDSVVSANDEYDDVGHLRATRAHARKSFVARSVNEHDAAAIHVNFGSANVLCDSTRLAGRDFCFADRVEQARFAVVHVPHDSDNGRPRHEIAGLLFLLGFLLHQLLFERNHLDDAAERFGQSCRCLGIERLVDACEDSLV